MEKNKKQEVKLEIQIEDDVANGQYINLAVVNHNDSEFVIDCIYVQPQAPKARVQSRLILSPRHAKRLLLALQNNIETYEKRFGRIELLGPGLEASEHKPIH
ncbi:DUF3467 domain-containing protein [Pelobacter seleniigenes]|uniref:DUF3467 domain-containing protein n=1 Tax=Pelobacter seleniigenes TaxID=407188 RepID=UPI0004A6E6B2|nr:DUF3467 domain-containing protein [Pelobacter seleniigenes]